jgi:Leucyl/phenylalanyl-tRNA protein transferase
MAQISFPFPNLAFLDLPSEIAITEKVLWTSDSITNGECLIISPTRLVLTNLPFGSYIEISSLCLAFKTPGSSECYFGSQIVSSCHFPYLDKICIDSRDDFMFLFSQADVELEFHDLVYLLKQSFFWLDSRNIWSLPNPLYRFCANLDSSGRNKKLKRLMSQGTVEFRVNHDFEKELRYTAEHHSLQKGSSWLTECEIAAILRIFRMNCDPLCISYDQISFISFSLYRKSDEKLLATSIGYGFGRNFHDITAATLEDSEWSFGRSLLRLEREFLNQNGYKLWYLGFEIDYMKELIHGKDGNLFDRREFLDRWKLNCIK